MREQHYFGQKKLCVDRPIRPNSAVSDHTLVAIWAVPVALDTIRIANGPYQRAFLANVSGSPTDC